jgi:hypothetical protein
MRRGSIVVECDNPDCYAERVFEHGDIGGELDYLLSDAGWGRRFDGNAGRDVCPECVREGAEAERIGDSHERAAARARNNDFADTGGKDWT